MSPSVSDLLKQAISIQEQERRRIARDLHDLLGQRVTALRFKIEALKCGRGDVNWKQSVEDLLGLTDQIDRELDFLGWELRPPELDAGLAAALQSLVTHWSKAYAIRGEFQAVGTGRLAPDVETCLYRIAQEALTNVVKHARASHVSVLLEYRSGVVVLIVVDDGRGFQAAPHLSAAACEPRIGLVGMHERAALVSGGVEIETGPGKGTAVFVRVPASFAPDDAVTAPSCVARPA